MFSDTVLLPPAWELLATHVYSSPGATLYNSSTTVVEGGGVALVRVVLGGEGPVALMPCHGREGISNCGAGQVEVVTFTGLVH